MYYLGKLCLRGHDHEGTGKSLRFRSNHNCMVCSAERARKYREAHLEKERERKRKYREAHLEKERERERKYRKDNPEKVRERKRKYRRHLAASYVRKKLKDTTGIQTNQITDEMIELKTVQLKIHRELEKAKGDLDNG